MNSFFELLKTRRSIRKYKALAIEPEKIQKITSAALLSPASKRSNPWEFVIVQEKETLIKLSESRQHGSHFLADAPLGIVVTADTTKSDVWMEDASIAAIIMQLQAHDLGLGSCWIQAYGRKKDDENLSETYIRNLLSIPQQFAILSILSIGYPDEERKPNDESRLDINKIHNESFSPK